MCETIYTVNKDRVGDYVKSLTAEETAAVNECLMNSIGLSYMSDFAEPYDKDYSDLQDEIDSLRSQNSTLKQQLEKNSDSTVITERDLYKRLYEQLLDKAVG